MSRKGTIKVMVGRNGSTRIQEDDGEDVKVYTREEWHKELERRAKKDQKASDSSKKDEKPITLPDPEPKALGGSKGKGKNPKAPGKKK